MLFQMLTFVLEPLPIVAMHRAHQNFFHKECNPSGCTLVITCILCWGLNLHDLFVFQELNTYKAYYFNIGEPISAFYISDLDWTYIICEAWCTTDNYPSTVQTVYACQFQLKLSINNKIYYGMSGFWGIAVKILFTVAILQHAIICHVVKPPNIIARWKVF